MSIRFGLGQSVRRLEDVDLIKGEGSFTDDLFPGEGLAVHFLRAPYAHARLMRLDTGAAKSAEGVKLVASQADLDADKVGDVQCRHFAEQPDGSTMNKTSKPPMVRDINRYAGDIVAMVVAETLGQARDAAELIEMDFETMAAVTDIYEAMADGAPQLYPEYPNNIAFEFHEGRVAEVREAMAKGEADGKRVFSIDIVNNRVMANSMETRPMVARPLMDGDGDDTGGVQVWTGCQGVVEIATQLGESLGLPQDKVQVLTGNVGGGFGSKIFLHPEQICIAWAARKLGAMVRWRQDRSEAFISDLHGRDNRSVARVLVDGEGRIEAYESTVHANLGAWLSNFGVFVPTMAGQVSMTGCYDIPLAGLVVKGVMTNTPAVDAYRGAGRPEANYLIERLMDMLAIELGIDRVELRRRNLIRPEQIPYRMALGNEIDSGDMPALLDEAMKKADWKGFAARRKESAASGRKRGIGLAMYIEVCGGGEAKDVELEFDSGGGLTAYVSQHDNGQGHRTTLTQILSHSLGYDASKISVVQGDSSRTPEGNTGGARMTALLGSTLAEASKLVIDRARADAASHLEAPEADIGFDDGIFTAGGTNRSVTLEEIALAAGRDGSPHPYSLKHTFSTAGASYPYGCHIAEVEIDPSTCEVEVVRLTVVDDFGRVVNPLTLEGQIHGGVAQGVGQALFEHLPYDGEGQLLAGSLMDYTLPRADVLPRIDVHTRNTPCKNNPLGVKGSGEAGAIGSTPAALSAVCDALGIDHIDMPATPQRIWERLNG